MSPYRHTLLAALLIAVGSPVILAQALAPPPPVEPKAPAIPPVPSMGCKGVFSPQWDSCVGVLTYPNGNIYTGEFHHGQREGLGMIVIRARGTSDENQILSSEPNTIYAGEFRGDRLNGRGIWITQGAAYAGTFVNNIGRPDVAWKACSGEPSGWTHCIAKLSFPNGNSYTGEFMHGVREGLGLLQINERGASDANSIRAPKQAFYVGEFKNGRLNGRGMITIQDGEGYIGTFTDNVLASPSSSGQDREVAAAMARLVSDPVEQQHVISAAARSTVLERNPCPGAQFSVEKSITFYNLPTLDDMHRVTSGAWKQVVQEQGCESRRQLNVLVAVEAADKMAVIPMLPGSTRADPVLQKDAVRYAVQALASVPGGREANCDSGYVSDTEFLEEEKAEPLPGSKGRSWRESWTLISCTRKAIVPMRFIPDATGTTISAGPSTQIRVVPLAGGKQVIAQASVLTPPRIFQGR